MDTPTTPGALLRLFALLGATLLSVSSLTASTVQAQDAYHCIEDLSEDHVEYRINKIQRSFEDGQTKAAAWRFGWMFGLAGATSVGAYNLVSRENSPRHERFFEWALIGGAAAAILQFSIIPMPDVWGAKRIRKKKADTLEQKRAKLRYATQTLEKSSKIQAYFSGSNYWGGGIVYGVTMGSVYVAKYKDEYTKLPSRHDRVLARFRAAGLFLLPPTLTVGQSLTAPTHSYEYWEEYRSVACSDHYYDAGDTGPEFDLSVGGMKLNLTVRF